MFTDWYGEQSCTAGRASFITGQCGYPHRTDQGRYSWRGPSAFSAEDPTIAELLKPLGYATGQFGKNHLGDLNKYLPTVARLRRVLRQPLPSQCRGGAGDARLPTRERFPASSAKRFGPRGVLHCWATDKDDATEQPRWGRVGKQKIEDTGPLTKKRMETFDDEFVACSQGLHRSVRWTVTSPSSAWSTPPTCTCSPTPSRRASGKAGLAVALS